jgi:hypothetical protein
LADDDEGLGRDALVKLIIESTFLLLEVLIFINREPEQAPSNFLA